MTKTVVSAHVDAQMLKKIKAEQAKGVTISHMVKKGLELYFEPRENIQIQHEN